MTNDTLLPFDLPAVRRKKLTVDFDGSNRSPDTGLLLLREAEHKLGRVCDLLGSLDDEGWPEIHWPRDIVEIGGGFQHGFVDLGELLLSAATLDADDTVEFFVARWHGWIDSEETAQVDFTVGLYFHLFQSNSPQGALRRIADHHAGTERRQEIFLWTGEAVRSA